MTTKNTLQDVQFAELYLDVRARRGPTPESRARARVLIAVISVLDVTHPTWRSELLATFEKEGISREVEEMFPLPVFDGNTLFADFLKLVTGPTSEES